MKKVRNSLTWFSHKTDCVSEQLHSLTCDLYMPRGPTSIYLFGERIVSSVRVVTSAHWVTEQALAGANHDGTHKSEYATSGAVGEPHWSQMFHYLLLHYVDLRFFNTVFVFVDNRDLTAPRTDQES